MRISNLAIKNNFIDGIRKNYHEMKKVQKQMITGKRMDRPSVDPMAAINSVYNRTRLNKISQYKENIGVAASAIDISHDKVSSAVNVMHRIREMAIQSANGIYGDDERQAMAMEVEELLREMVSIGNTANKDGYLFSGARVEQKPYRVFTSAREGISKPLVTQVEYNGNYLGKEVEIDSNDRVTITTAGSHVFWGDTHTVVALKDSGNYVADRDQTIRIDGQEVEISRGDNIDAVIEKINLKVPAVSAFKRVLPDGRVTFGIESNYPHQLAIEDIEGSQVMQDLGILRGGLQGRQVGNNIHPNTLQGGASIFDIVIRFRDSLLDNRLEKIGGRDLGSITTGMNNMLLNQARISSAQSRLDIVNEKIVREEELATERLAKNEDMDMATASVNFNQLANIHRISLMTASKLVQPTLMDYLR